MYRSWWHTGILMIPLLLGGTPGYAQEAPVARYQARSIYLQSGLFRDRFVQGGETHSTGFFAGRLKEAMQDSPAAMAEMRAFTHRHLAAMGFGTVAAGFSIAATIAAWKDRKDFDRGLTVGAAVFSLVGNLFEMAAGRSLQRAVWLHNRDIFAHQSTEPDTGMHRRQGSAGMVGLSVPF